MSTSIEYPLIQKTFILFLFLRCYTFFLRCASPNKVSNLFLILCLLYPLSLNSCLHICRHGNDRQGNQKAGVIFFLFMQGFFWNVMVECSYSVLFSFLRQQSFSFLIKWFGLDSHVFEIVTHSLGIKQNYLNCGSLVLF